MPGFQHSCCSYRTAGWRRAGLSSPSPRRSGGRQRCPASRRYQHFPVIVATFVALLSLAPPAAGQGADTRPAAGPRQGADAGPADAAPAAPWPHGADSGASPARPDSALQGLLERLVEGFGGDAGIYVRHLGTGATAAIRADETFPTASLIKIPLLLTLFDRVERGLLDLDARVAYPDTLTYAYTEATDVVGYMQPGDTLPLSQLAFLMLATSDNLASLWIQAMVGGGEAVNEWLATSGFQRTRVNSRTPGREADRSEFGWGQTSPREMAELLVMIRQGRAVSERASERMYRLLTNSYWDREALSEIPPTVQAASKQGFVSRSRSEVVLVNAASGDFVVAVITKNQTDTSYDADNEGFRLIRRVTRVVYEHFEPADAWRPAR